VRWSGVADAYGEGDGDGDGIGDWSGPVVVFCYPHPGLKRGAHTFEFFIFEDTWGSATEMITVEVR